MLCDSVGITPVPNNGTLRLPLKTIGLHDDASTSELDPPADPVEANSTPSSTASEPTKPILVNPVPTTSDAQPAAPTNTIGVDQPGPQAQPTPSPSAGGGSDSDSDEASGVDKVESSVKDFWEWFTGKVNKWWDKVTGHGEGENGGEEEGSSSG
jgi:hypothetical protein